MSDRTVAEVEHTEKMMREARLAERERCAKLAESEEELTDHMPDALHLVPAKDLARAVCRATKKSIARAIRAESP